MPLRRRDMDSRSQAPHKSRSFSPATTAARDDDDAGGNGKPIDRNLSLGAARQHADHHHHHPVPAAVAIKEECEEEEEEVERDHATAAAAGDGNAAPCAGGEGGVGDGEGGEPDLTALSVEIDAFIAAGGEQPPVSEATLERFASAVETEIAQSESSVSDRWATGPNGEPRPLLAAISRIAALAAALRKNPEGNKHATAGAHRVTTVLHRAMAFLEDEFHALLEANATKPQPSSEHEADRCVLPAAAAAAAASDAAGAGAGEPPVALPYPAETVERLRSMADAMVSAGYVTECTQMFLVARRNAFDASLRSLGYEKASIDDVARMAWESLEAEIATWTCAFRHATSVGLSTERDLAARVFSGRNAGVGRAIFADLARCVMLHMLSFAEAVAVTKHAAEKLFKVLDMYDAIRDAAPIIDAFIAADSNDTDTTTALTDLRDELAAVRSRIGESAAAIFLELEISIRTDAGKQPVPGGAVHPLTRYIMNYLKYACEYNSTLEQIFRDHHHHHNNNNNNSSNNNLKPFAAQLMEVMELLQANLEGKSRLYKDASLSNIFLMNNGRYMLQKIRGSPETNAMLGGEAWARKQSTNLRQYHKNYQRETWSRVLNLLKDDGVITVKGSVQKPVLKERFKQFNAAMDEIQRTQGSWVVSDEQLQSELRVSIAAVVVPAYRSFLGRFAQTFSAGRQTEKYVKLSADDVEAIIDELFDGNATSMARRRT